MSLNWNKRIGEWGIVIAQAGEDAHGWRYYRFFYASAFKMLRAVLSGPVPANVWHNRMRVCIRCPIRDPLTRACRKRMSDGRILGCSARSVTDDEGWPEYVFPSAWSKLKAVWRFFAVRK